MFASIHRDKNVPKNPGIKRTMPISPELTDSSGLVNTDFHVTNYINACQL